MKSLVKIQGHQSRTTAVVVCADGMWVRHFTIKAPNLASEWMQKITEKHVTPANPEVIATSWDDEQVLTIEQPEEGTLVVTLD